MICPLITRITRIERQKKISVIRAIRGEKKISAIRVIRGQKKGISKHKKISPLITRIK